MSRNIRGRLARLERFSGTDKSFVDWDALAVGDWDAFVASLPPDVISAEPHEVRAQALEAEVRSLEALNPPTEGGIERWLSSAWERSDEKDDLPNAETDQT